MKLCYRSICWALAMVALALAARFGWADRDAAITVLLVMPLIAFTSILSGRRGCARARG